MFPTTKFDDAIALAATFTDVTLGTLQDVIEIFADNNDNANTRGIAAVVGQEGEQEGFFRLLQNKGLIPNELPFLTRSTRDFAFSALQGFVNGDCAGDDTLKADGLKIFGVLNLLTTNIQPVDQLLTFSFDINSLKNSANLDFGKLFSGSTSQYGSWAQGGSPSGNVDWTNSNLYLQYINQQNIPIPEQLQNVKVAGSVVTFQANFPFVENLLNGLTIGAVTVGSNFTSAQAVADATLFAPALIEVN